MDADQSDEKRSQPQTHLLANLRELMAAWFAARDQGGETADVEQRIAAEAAAQGLSLGFKSMALVDVPDDGFPLVLLEKGGASRLVLARLNLQTYLCLGQGARYEVSAATLAQVESGTVFFARALRPQNKADQSAASKAADSDIEDEALSSPSEEPAGFRRHSSSSQIPFSLWRSPTVRDLIAGMTRGHGRLLAALAATGLIGNLLFIALPVFSMAVYDKVVPHNASETMVALSIGVILALITDFGLRAVRTKLSDALALRVQVDMTSRVLRHLLAIRMVDAPREPAPLLMALRDLEGFCQILPSLFISLTIDILFVVAICIFLAMLGGYVGLVPLVGLFLLGLAYGISHFMAEREGEKSQALQRQQSSLVISVINALETIKAHHGEEAIGRRFNRLVDQSAYAGHRERHFGTLANQAAIMIAQAMTVLAMVFSVIAIAAGSMTIGAMSAAAMIISRIMPPLSQMIGSFHRLWQMRRGIERIDLLMAQPQESFSYHRKINPSMTGPIRFDGVSLLYPGSTRKAVEHIHFTIEPGEKIGLVGRIGCGKTSLLRLMARLAAPSEGSIRLDGFDLEQYDPRALRRHVGFLRQDAQIFGGSPHAHLGLGLDLPEYDDQRIKDALAISGAEDFVKRHPKGLAMATGADGQFLSGGERQALALARLILGDPKIVLLDEPTSAMDNALEAHVIRSLQPWMRDRTLIVATHRVPFLALVDRLIVMDQGRIIADGPRDEILKRLRQTAA